MSHQPITRAPTLLVLSGLLTLAFIGCAGKTQVLNAMDAGAGGQEGEGLGPGSGGSGVAGKAGAHSQPASGGGSGRATGGSGNTAAGGSAGVGGSNSGAGNGGFGATAGGGFAGSGGDLAVGGAGTAGSYPGGYGGTSGNGGSAGSSGAGNTNGGVGNTGNYGGRGSAGSAGAGAPGLPPCDSSTGQGCSAGAFCVNLQTEGCDADAHSSCSGYCETSLSPPTCSGDDDCTAGMHCLPSVEHADERRCIGSETPPCNADEDCPDGFACREQTCIAFAASCNSVGSCENRLPDACPPWFTRAATDVCADPCIPVQECSCTRDADCPYPAACDRIRGRCAVATQAPGCSMTYDPGPCDGSYPVFAFVGGSCTAVRYGGCGGNDNRFGTIEECMLRCEGRPLTVECTDGRVSAHICLACAALGGCQTLGDFCAETCAVDRDCTTVGQSCLNGVCQATGCD